jgi:hypothetical protein
VHDVDQNELMTKVEATLDAIVANIASITESIRVLAEQVATERETRKEMGQPK